MSYTKGIPSREDTSRQDTRGRFGLGRPAHGSDPAASYGFGVPRGAIILEPPAQEEHPPALQLSSHLAVQDLQYEVHLHDEQTARMTISAPSIDGHSHLEFVFPLDHQAGHVEATLIQAQSSLIAFLEAVVRELKTRPLRLE